MLDDIVKGSFSEANRRYPNMTAEDNHKDAFRHAYASALLAQAFGNDWAQEFTTRHEQKIGNPADAEAMDLYNNEVGRSLAKGGWSTTGDRVQDALNGGQLVVVAPGGGALLFSDMVKLGQTGVHRDETLDGSTG